jgi:hypothetical protein
MDAQGFRSQPAADESRRAEAQAKILNSNRVFSLPGAFSDDLATP